MCVTLQQLSMNMGRMEHAWLLLFLQSAWKSGGILPNVSSSFLYLVLLMNKLTAPAMRQLLSLPWKHLHWQSHVRYFAIKEVRRNLTVACSRMTPNHWDAGLEGQAKGLENKHSRQQRAFLIS